MNSTVMRDWTKLADYCLVWSDVNPHEILYVGKLADFDEVGFRSHDYLGPVTDALAELYSTKQLRAVRLPNRMIFSIFTLDSVI